MRTEDAATTADVLDTSHGSAAATPPPTKIGRYVVLGELGRGGMGIVLRAYDSVLRREVALKCVTRRDLGAEGETRLLREARVMARLNHPNVVTVFGVEIDAGRIALVMELVEGTTLAAWVAAGRSWSEVVEAYIQAGRGLAAAHRHCILHRDFKPNNVLIDPDGRVRVTDFGIAVVRPQTTAHESSDTADEIVGTLPYMAPEQHAGQPLDERTDIYAYCASLWESLNGSMPFGSAGMSAGELRHTKWSGPPRWPHPSPVSAPVRRAIQRGLAPRASDRWASVDALLSALDGRRARRRRRLYVGIGVTTAALAGVAAATRASLDRCAEVESQLADRWNGDLHQQVAARIHALDSPYAGVIANRILPRLDAYAERWIDIHAKACRATSRTGGRMGHARSLQLACLDGARARFTAVTTVLNEPTQRTLDEAHELVSSLPSLRRCEDLGVLLEGAPAPADDEQRERVAELRLQVAEASALEFVGRYAAALATLERIERDARAVSYPPLHVELALHRARLEFQTGDYARAAATFRSVVSAGLEHRQWDEARLALQGLGLSEGVRLAKPERGLVHAELASAILSRPAFSPLERAEGSKSEADVVQHMARYEEAEQRYRRALAVYEENLPPDDARLGLLLSNLHLVVYQRGRYDEAEQGFRRALAIYEAGLGPDHPMVADVRENLGIVLVSRGDQDGAEAEFRRALAIRTSRFGANHPELARVAANLALVLDERGKFQEAEHFARRALQFSEETLGPEHPETGRAAQALAWALQHQQRYEEAEALHRRGVAMETKAWGERHPTTAIARSGLAEALEGRGKFAEAEGELRAAIDVLEASKGSQHPQTCTLYTQLANLLTADQRPGDAASVRERATACGPTIAADEGQAAGAPASMR